MNGNRCGAFFAVAIVVLLSSADSKVLELSDRFVPLRSEGMWLIMFYAPWCGHCKKLEPIWKLVDQSLNHLPLRIGRIDCTRFTAVAQELSISGFPTVMFFKGDATYSYEGDRTREDIVAFAKRLMGPPVTEISSVEDFDLAKETSEIFFLFSGYPEGPEWDKYLKVATTFQQHEFFYLAPPEIAEKFSNVKEIQTIRVYKDGTSFPFDGDSFEDGADRLQRSLNEGTVDDPLQEVSQEQAESSNNASLVNWISKERFPRFVKVTRGKFGHLLFTNKLLVMAVLEENKIGKLTPDMEDFRSMLQLVLERNLDRYRPHFQFGWTGAPDLANSVAMETLSLPNLLVINTTTYQHYLPYDDPTHLTAEAIQIFLDDILEGNAPVYGGSSYSVRLYRAYYGVKSNVVEMWKGNPALAAVLFGLPMGFFALICYSICCADIMDAEEDEDEDESLIAASRGFHEKTD